MKNIDIKEWNKNVYSSFYTNQISLSKIDSLPGMINWPDVAIAKFPRNIDELKTRTDLLQ